jgi:hypothetical protein
MDRVVEQENCLALIERCAIMHEPSYDYERDPDFFNPAHEESDDWRDDDMNIDDEEDIDFEEEE